MNSSSRKLDTEPEIIHVEAARDDNGDVVICFVVDDGNNDDDDAADDNDDDDDDEEDEDDDDVGDELNSSSLSSDLITVVLFTKQKRFGSTRSTTFEKANIVQICTHESIEVVMCIHRYRHTQHMTFIYVPSCFSVRCSV